MKKEKKIKAWAMIYPPFRKNAIIGAEGFGKERMWIYKTKWSAIEDDKTGESEIVPIEIKILKRSAKNK